MNSDKLTEEELKEFLAEIRASERFPLELVATTALHFLRDEDQRSDTDSQKRAINIAITFLDLCNTQRTVKGTLDSYITKQLEGHGWEPNDNIPYREGIKFITGQKRFDRAQEYYEAFRKNDWQLEKPLTPTELTAALKKDEQEGFVAQSLVAQRFMFERSRMHGLLHLKRRRKIQKGT